LLFSKKTTTDWEMEEITVVICYGGTSGSIAKGALGRTNW
jgi:hypothetical protein